MRCNATIRSIYIVFDLDHFGIEHVMVFDSQNFQCISKYIWDHKSSLARS